MAPSGSQRARPWPRTPGVPRLISLPKFFFIYLVWVLASAAPSPSPKIAPQSPRKYYAREQEIAADMSSSSSSGTRRPSASSTSTTTTTVVIDTDEIMDEIASAIRSSTKKASEGSGRGGGREGVEGVYKSTQVYQHSPPSAQAIARAVPRKKKRRCV